VIEAIGPSKWFRNVSRVIVAAAQQTIDFSDGSFSAWFSHLKDSLSQYRIGFLVAQRKLKAL